MKESKTLEQVIAKKVAVLLQQGKTIGVASFIAYRETAEEYYKAIHGAREKLDESASSSDDYWLRDERAKELLDRVIRKADEETTGVQS
jgi:S-adenosylhomocysteine hydrolase